MRSRSERGSVTVVAAGLMAVAAVMCLLTVDLSHALSAKRRAQTAADAAALAAAAELVAPSGRGLEEVAAEYAERNGARLIACHCPDGELDVVVAVEVPLELPFLPSQGRRLIGRARATVDLPAADQASGLVPGFAAQLSCLFARVPGLSIVSGYRTRAQQAALHRDKPRLAAPPGRSLHELGLAADLAFATPGAARRAHAEAPACGLGFDVPGEPWHVAPAGLE